MGRWSAGRIGGPSARPSPTSSARELLRTNRTKPHRTNESAESAAALRPSSHPFRLGRGASLARAAARSCSRPAAWLAALLILTAAALADSSGRYLLIVDTSRSMQHRSEATLRVVQDLLDTGMRGELKPGDTLGLWTFNKDLNAGRFPLQVWVPDQQKAIAQHVVKFLKAQPCEKQATLEKVVPALKDVIGGSEMITVILISAGDAKISGTPFDGPINDDYQRWHNDQENGQVPLVTIIRASGGKMVRCSVKPASEKVELPPLPETAARPEPVPAHAAPAPPPVPPPPAPEPPRIGQPLILSGRKLHPEAANNPAAATNDARPPAAKPEPSPAATAGASQPRPSASSSSAAASAPPSTAPSTPTAAPTPLSSNGFQPLPMAGSYRPLAATDTPPVSDAAVSRSEPKPEPRSSSLALSDHGGTGVVAWAAVKSAPLPPAAKPRGSSLAWLKSLTRFLHLPQWSSVTERLVTWLRSSPIRLWQAGVVAAAVGLVFVFLRLRNTRQAQPLSLITRSFERDSHEPAAAAAFPSTPSTRPRG